VQQGIISRAADLFCVLVHAACVLVAHESEIAKNGLDTSATHSRNHDSAGHFFEELLI
jgi:hypothetical protein